ncbi:MAG: hypothetical protein AAB904_01350, partial [Patescibacteria group bacterium]
NFVPTAVFDNDGSPNRVYCFGDTVGKVVGGGGAPEHTSEFSYTNVLNGVRLTISVFKDQSFDGDATDDTTTIFSRGYNKTAVDTRTAERALRDVHRNPY